MHIPKCQHLNSPWEVQWLNQPSSIHRESVGEANSSPDSCHVIWTQCKWSWLCDQGKVTSWMESDGLSPKEMLISAANSDSKQQSPRGDHTFSDNSLQGFLFASLGLILAPDLFTPPPSSPYIFFRHGSVPRWAEPKIFSHSWSTMLLIFFNWSVIALQSCVSFYRIAKWISYMYTYIPTLLDFLSV